MNLILVSGHNHKSFTYQGKRLSSVECQDERISYSVIVCMCAVIILGYINFIYVLQRNLSSLKDVEYSHVLTFSLL